MDTPNIALIVAILSLVGTIIMAVGRFRGAQIGASDEIATGSKTLLAEYREVRKTDKGKISGLTKRVECLEKWKTEMEDYIIPFWRGSKRNEYQLIALDQTPVFQVPDLPAIVGEEKKR